MLIDQLNAVNSELRQNNERLPARLAKESLIELDLNDIPSSPPQTAPFPPITVDILIEKFESKFKNTNSTGVKDMITCMKSLRVELVSETDTLAMISQKMRQISKAREDSAWSKSHVFFKGRHQGIQDLYTILANDSFSLNNPGEVQTLLDLIDDENRQFLHCSPKI